MKHVTANKIREIDNLAQTKYSIPSVILMENAGRSASEEILKVVKSDLSKRIAIFSGRGNNGGDGFVAARHLHCEGLKADVFILGKILDVKRQDPLTNLKILKKMGLKVTELVDMKSIKKLRRKFGYDIIVDAIFGTGFSGKMPPYIASLINFLNNTGLEIISIDVPSGMDATTGEIHDISIRAAKTVTFGLPKTGFLKAQGPNVIGEVITRNISYPLALIR